MKGLLIIFPLAKTELIYLFYSSSKVHLNKTFNFRDFDDVIKKTADISKKNFPSKCLEYQVDKVYQVS